MAKLTTKFIGVNQITDELLRFLSGGWLRSRNAAGTADINVLRVNSSDVVEFASVPEVAADPTTNNGLTRKSYVLSLISASSPVSSVNGATGVVVLTTSDIAEGTNLYFTTGRASAAAPVQSVAGKTGSVTLDTGDVSEGANLYFTAARAKTAAVLNTLAGSETDQAPSVAAVNTALGAKISSSEKGANSGVATLDGGGKIPASQLPNTVMELQGQYNASTNTPSLSDGTGNAGDVYEVTVAGTRNFGNGAITFAVGDFVIYGADGKWFKSLNSNEVTSVNGQVGVVVLTTSDVAEGTAQYFTAARAKTAAVLNTLAGSETDQAPSVSAVNSALSGKQGTFSWNKESKTLVSGDVTAQYIDLAQVVKANSLDLVISGIVQTEGVDYDLSLTGGAGGKTRLTFKTGGDLCTGGAAALVAGDVLLVKYAY
jgi:hypothetical protein